MGLQQNILRKFMRTMNHTVNSNTTTLLDSAVLSCQSNYATIQQVIDDCVVKLTSSATYDDFLKEYCGIILDNTDTGSITGLDAKGEGEKSAESIVPEKDISEWEMPTTQDEVIAGLKVTYPAFTGLSPEETFIVGALHTWWIPQALSLGFNSFGFSFNDVDAEPKEIEVKFATEAVGLLAHVDYYWNMATYPTDGKCNKLELVVNMTMYNTIDTTDPNGATMYGTTALPYLDRTIAHEFVHASQAANIAYFPDLPLWFSEGSAELVHGIDDKRRINIIDITSNPARFASAFTTSPVSSEDAYSAGYILLRFFTKQVALFYAREKANKRHLMVERGNVKSLKAVGEKFLEFAQKSRNNVQAWELVDDRLSSFYGATLRVPIRKYEDVSCNEDYYVYGNSLLDSHGSTNYPTFIDKIKNRYQRINVTEDYNINDLDLVLGKISALSDVKEKSHFAFNGCEANITAGDNIPTVISKIKDIVDKCNDYKSEPVLFITPNPDMYDGGGNLIDNYEILLRSSYISGKVNVVCLGDSLTDYTGGSSWTPTFQEDNPNIYVVNKGIGGNVISDAVARFQTDVIDQSPDICFFLIGGNDMWESTPSQLATAEASYRQMVDDCINNNITPVIGLYTLTAEQVKVMAQYFTITEEEIMMNFRNFQQFCEELAKSYNLKTIDVYHDLKNLDGTINRDNLVDDVHPSVQGNELMGHYISKQMQQIIIETQQSLDTKGLQKVNVYDIFCEALNTDNLSLAQLESMMCSEKIHYADGESQDYISDYVIVNHILRPLNCPYFYVSFEHMTVTSDTYPNWLRTGYRLEEYIAHDHDNNDEYSDWHTDIYYQSEKYNHSINLPASTRHVFGKYGGQDRENIFKNTGEFIAVGLHTLFDKDIWMCEQGGITCEREAQQQINDLNFLPCRSSVTPYNGRAAESGEVQLPVFPGTGCPWFTISDDNKVTFDISINGIDYWFTKSDYDATITIRVSNGGQDFDCYQSISLGMMTTTDAESYMFPLYVAGGNQALSQDIYIYTPIHYNTIVYPTHKKGNVYDLDIQNICLSNSNLLHPTKFNDANMSNFRILSPEGEWKDIYAHSQTATVKNYATCSSRVTQWGIVLEDVVHGMASSYHSAFPFMGDNRYMIDLYTVNEKLNQYKHSSVLDKVVISLKQELPHLETGIEGTIPNVYSSWYRTLPVGEIDIDGRKYLSVPNGWEERLWNYPWFLGMYNDEQYWKNENIRKTYDDLHRPMSQNKMVSRLIIPLEEGA